MFGLDGGGDEDYVRLRAEGEVLVVLPVVVLRVVALSVWGGLGNGCCRKQERQKRRKWPEFRKTHGSIRKDRGWRYKALCCEDLKTMIFALMLGGSGWFPGCADWSFWSRLVHCRDAGEVQ